MFDLDQFAIEPVAAQFDPFRIEALKRLVEDHQFWPFHEGPREQNQPLLSRREALEQSLRKVDNRERRNSSLTRLFCSGVVGRSATPSKKPVAAARAAVSNSEK